MAHVSVLLQELVAGLALTEGDTAVDATINGGGHSFAVSHAIGRSGTLVGIDLDRDALAKARERLSEASCRVILVEANFSEIANVLQQQGIGEVGAVFFDLGLSRDQLEYSRRGFSFERDEPLIMTFAADGGISGTRTAADIVNGMNERELADLLFRYGQERASRKIAKAIVSARARQRILTTLRLADIVAAVAPRRSKIHPATKTFQALRIAVNDELGNLTEGLRQALSVLKPGGRIAVISFHSLEDGEVKRTFRLWQQEGKGTIITKKPIRPGDEELRVNPRSRSASLRLFEKSFNHHHA